MLCVFTVSRAMFRLAPSSLLTEGVYGSLRHSGIYFFGMSACSGTELPKPGREAFEWGDGLILVLGVSCLGNCSETGFLLGGNQTSGSWARGSEDGLRRCGAGFPQPLPQGLEPGENPWLLAMVPAFCHRSLAGQHTSDAVGPLMARTGCPWVEAGVPLLRGQSSVIH